MTANLLQQSQDHSEPQRTGSWPAPARICKGPSSFRQRHDSAPKGMSDKALKLKMSLSMLVLRPLVPQARADKVIIQSLEHQLNDAQQQFHWLLTGQNLSATKEQLAAQQLQTNEQLKALQHECNTAHEATEQVTSERDAVCRDSSRYRSLSLRWTQVDTGWSTSRHA